MGDDNGDYEYYDEEEWCGGIGGGGEEPDQGLVSVNVLEEDRLLLSTTEVQRLADERAQLVPYIKVPDAIRQARRPEQVMVDSTWYYAFFSKISAHYLSATKGIKLFEGPGPANAGKTPAKFNF